MTADPRVSYRVHDVFTAWPGDQPDVIKVANLLRRLYFSDADITRALCAIHESPAEGGHLLVVDNSRIPGIPPGEGFTARWDPASGPSRARSTAPRSTIWWSASQPNRVPEALAPDGGVLSSRQHQPVLRMPAATPLMVRSIARRNSASTSSSPSARMRLSRSTCR